MAIGKANIDLNLKKLSINFGNIKIIDKGQLHPNYQEIEVKLISIDPKSGKLKLSRKVLLPKPEKNNQE